MKQLKNKKGMTLVEIIVALLIASILLVIMGSLILNSFSYFNKTTDQSLNKQSLDSVGSFVREQLLYTSDVRVDTKKPEGENWKAFYIKDGRLFHDDDMMEGNDEQLFSDQFYNKNILRIEAKGYGSYRLDLKYEYLNSDNEKSYQTSDTLELLNVKVKNEKDNAFNPLSNIQDKAVLVDSTYRIYYQQIFEYKEPVKPDSPTQGTVADQMKCLTLHNNRQKYKGGFYYRTGDMVFHKREQDSQGYWWMMIYETSNTIWEDPGSGNMYWKKIDAKFDKMSAYLKGDVVMHEGNYYRFLTHANTSFTPEPGSPDSAKVWEKLDKQPEGESLCSYERKEREDSIIYKLLNAMETGNFTLEDIPLYEDKNYNKVDNPSKKEDFVKVFDNELLIYRYYLKMVDGHKTVKPGETAKNDLVWQEIKVDWDKNSYYTAGDVVFYATGQKRYVNVKESEKVDVPGIVPPSWDDPDNPWKNMKDSLDKNRR